MRSVSNPSKVIVSESIGSLLLVDEGVSGDNAYEDEEEWALQNCESEEGDEDMSTCDPLMAFIVADRP